MARGAVVTPPQQIPRTIEGLIATLDAARKRKGYSIRAAAKAIDLPAATVQGWLNGRHLPSPQLYPSFIALLDELGLLSSAADADAWLDAVTALKSGRDSSPNRGCPYRGLQPYTEHDGDIFFGRTGEVDQLLQRVESALDAGPGLIFVVAPSGAGKTSLLRAGVVGQARSGSGRLAGLQVDYVTAARDDLAPLRQALETPHGSRPRLLIIDQFERLLDPAYRTPGDEAVGWIEHALRQAEPGQLVIVIALRADFFARAVEIPQFRSSLQSPVLLAAPSPEAMAEVIVRPAEARGKKVADGVLAAILADFPVDAQASSLPLVSQALAATWEASAGADLTLTAYHKVGGVAGAVNRTAEATFAELSEAEQGIAKELFLRTVRTEGDVVMSEPIRLEGLTATEVAVADALAAGGLVTLTEEHLVLSHESLTRHWQRLREWIDEGHDRLQLRALLTRAANVWRQRGRDENLLLAPALFAEASRGGSFEREVTEYLEAGETQAKRELQAERAISRRLAGRSRIAWSAMALALVLAVISGLALVRTRGFELQAITARDEALSRQLSLTSARLSLQDPNVGAQIALAAHQVAPTVEGRSALLAATGGDLVTRSLGANRPTVLTTGDADSGLMLAAGGQGQVRVWEYASFDATARPRWQWQVPGASSLFVGTIVVGPDRPVVIIGGQGGLWAYELPADGVPGAPLWHQPIPATAYSLAWQPTRRIVNVGTGDGQVLRWQLDQHGREPQPLPALPAEKVVRALAVSPAEDELLVASGDRGVARWRLTEAQASPLPTVQTARRAQTLTFNDAGDGFAVGFAAKMVTVYGRDGDSWAEQKTLTDYGSWINSVRFGVEPGTLLVASSDQKAYVEDLQTGEHRRMLPHPSIVTGMVPHGDRFATAATDGSIRWWSQQAVGLGFNRSDWMQAATDGGSIVAASGRDRAVGVWELGADGAVEKALPLPNSEDAAPAITVLPAGKGIVGGDYAGRLLLWRRTVEGLAAPTPLPGFDGLPVGLIRLDRRGESMVALTPAHPEVLLYRRDGDGYRKVADLPVSSPQAAAFSADGRLLAVAGVDNEVLIWPLDDGKPAAQPVRLADFDDVGTAMVFRPEQPELLMGTDSGVVRRWDLTDLARPRHLPLLEGAQAAIYGLDIAPDGNRVAAGSGDERLWMWRLDDGGRASASVDSGMGRVNDVQFVAGGTSVLGVGLQGGSRLWTVDEASARRSLCARIGDPLVESEWQRHLTGLPHQELCR